MNKLMKHYYTHWLLLPGLLLFIGLFIIPSLGSFYYAFTDWNGLRVTRFVGWENFLNLFDGGDNFLAFKNTLIFTVITTFFKITLGLLLAILLNMKLRSTMYLRTVFFFPVILSTVAVALAFSAIFHPSHGLLNECLRLLHLDSWTQSWITNPHIVIYSVSMVEIWKYAGLHMMLLLAGLQSISNEPYEAATIDGANALEKFRYITIPLMIPIIKANILISLISGLKVFDIVIALTNGGPGGASNVINTIIFKSFAAQRYGEGTAANLLLFILILVVVLILNKILSKKEVEV
ncbi:carbohydrate ABC transporter permease [Paenibacillus eucommiae]|uniref:Raffinose/stachyose/melibiose transport system permease protein n=1 Tax=Paenibacillus eucommiae TaxID=1355755 RepID=A0ABS4IZ01_9BACL|nr:sugar ABC transporter permease [Paenibacillus eucommiae]MBP1992191.1 raffinose/stachyose/melibiose transport system permease protein [Paenibacillus eucommiae]